MNVAMLTLMSRRAGGLFYSVRGLSKAYVAAGLSPRVYSPRDQFSQKDMSVWDPVPIDLYSTFGPLQSSLKLRRLLRESKPDVIHLHGIWLDNQSAALHWQKKTDGPVVISPRGMLDPWALKNASWKKKIAGALFANESSQTASCIHALCRSEAESIRSYGIKGPVALIPNGVELPVPGKLETGDDQRRQLLFLGRIHPKKGIRELIDAWAQSGISCDWKLLVAGWDDGGHEQELKDLVTMYELGGSVQFMGPIFGEAKEQLLRRVDAFILPSFSEGLPMSVLEAWSYSLPVVMTDFCNLPEGMAAGAALRIAPDVQSIATGLETLAGLNKAELGGIGGEGRRLVEEKFNWPGIAKKMRQVYEWCLTKKDMPACVEINQ